MEKSLTWHEFLKGKAAGYKSIIKVWIKRKKTGKVFLEKFTQCLFSFVFLQKEVENTWNSSPNLKEKIGSFDQIYVKNVNSMCSSKDLHSIAFDTVLPTLSVLWPKYVGVLEWKKICQKGKFLVKTAIHFW